MHVVVETATYLTRCKQAGVSAEEQQGIIELLAQNPKAGDLIPRSGGARKVRYAREGSGRSGGYRLITYYAASDVPVFLLDVYGKGQQANISQSGVNALAKVLATVAAKYRADSRAAAAARKKKGST